MNASTVNCTKVVAADQAQDSIWSRLRLSYVTAVCGLALATVAAFAMEGWEGQGAGGRAGGPSLQVRAAAAARYAGPSYAEAAIVYYIVDSQTGAEYVWSIEEEARKSREAASQAEPPRDVHIRVVTSPQEYNDVMNELSFVSQELSFVSHGSVRLELVDMR